MSSTTGKTAAKKAAPKVTGPTPAQKADADKVVTSLRTRIESVETDRGTVLYDTAGEFTRLVVTGKVMAQGEFADRIFGKVDSKGETVKGSAGAMSTIVKRLAAARALGVEHGSLEWRFLVQKGGTGTAGSALAKPKAQAKRALTSAAKEWERTGKNTTSSRKPGTERKETEETVTKAATAQDVLKAVEKFYRAMPADQREGFSSRMVQMLEKVTKEVTSKGSNRNARTGTDG